MRIKIISIIKDYGSKVNNYNGKITTVFSKLCEIEGHGQRYINTYGQKFHDLIIAGLEIKANQKIFKDGVGYNFSIYKDAFNLPDNKQGLNKFNRIPEEKISVDSYISLAGKLYQEALKLNGEKPNELFQIMLNNANFFIDKKLLKDKTTVENVNQAFGDNTGTGNPEDDNIPF